MGEKGDKNRQRIIQTADELFYQNGFEHTSFSDIASAVGIAKGNFYYYFKSKDDILSAVLEKRNDDMRQMIDDWNREISDPRDRIKRYLYVLIKSQTDIEDFGCPLGSICTELSKLRHDLQSEAAKVFEIFRVWLEDQFTQLGFTEDAHYLALHLLGRLQGVSLVTSSYAGVDFLQREVQELERWVDQL